MVNLAYIITIGAVLAAAEVSGLLIAIDVVMRPHSSQGTIYRLASPLLQRYE